MCNSGYLIMKFILFLHQNIINGFNRCRYIFFIQHIPQICFNDSANGCHRNIVDCIFKWIFTGITNHFHGMEYPGNHDIKRNAKPDGRRR